MKSIFAFLFTLILPISLAFSAQRGESTFSNSAELWERFEAHLAQNRLSGIGTVTVLVNEYNRQQMIFYWTQKLAMLAKSKSRTYYMQNRAAMKSLKDYIARAESGEEFIYERSYEISPHNFMEKMRQFIVSGVVGVQFSFDSGNGQLEDTLKVSLDEAIEQGWFNDCESLLFNRSFQK